MGRKRNQSKRIAGWICLSIGLLCLVFASYVLYSYYQLKATTIEAENPASIWESVGLLFVFAAIGSNLLLYAGALILISMVIIFIAVVMIRRS